MYVNQDVDDLVDGTKENSTVTSALTSTQVSRSMEQDDEFSAEDIFKDIMSTLSCVSDGYFNMKNYGETTLALTETSPFTIVTDCA